MKCLKCGTELSPNVKFCSQCGAPRPELPPGFQESERSFASLRAQRDAGTLTPQEFDKALEKLVVGSPHRRAPGISRRTALVGGGALLILCVTCLLIQTLLVVTSEPQSAASDALTVVAQAVTRDPAVEQTRSALAQETALAQDVSAPSPVTTQRVETIAPTILAEPTVAPILPTGTPTPLPTPTQAVPEQFVRFTDTFDVSPAQALFGSDHMTFTSEGGQGVLTGNLSGAILPVMYASPRLQDFRAEVDIILPAVLTGSSYGLIFRSAGSQGRLENYYMVTVSPAARRVELFCYVDKLFPCNDSASIAEGVVQAGRSNRLRVQVIQSEFHVYLNDALVLHTIDFNLTGPGYFGLAIVPMELVPDTVRFDNFAIYPDTPQVAGAVTQVPSHVPTEPAVVIPPTPLPPTLTPTSIPPTRARTPIPPTRTPTPLPPSVAGPCPNPAADLYWSDDFSNTQSGWMDFQGTQYNHFYKDGEWHFAVTGKNETGTSWIQLRDLGTRYRVQVRAWRLAGPDLNNYGLVFGGQDDFNYYTFRISDAGQYRIAKHVQDHWVDLQPWTKAAAINRGGVNTLTMLVDGAQLYACVNGTLVGTANDPALQTGRVGMIAGAYDEPVHIHFDDIATWKLQGPVTVTQGGASAPPPATIPSDAPAGVYVTSLRTSDPNPKRNTDVTFVATFLNSTGAAQPFNWVVMVYQPDAKKAFGETGVQSITVPVGVSELTSASNWGVRGPGGCVSLYARAYYEAGDGSRTPFKQPDGNDITHGFAVCP